MPRLESTLVYLTPQQSYLLSLAGAYGPVAPVGELRRASGLAPAAFDEAVLALVDAGRLVSWCDRCPGAVPDEECVREAGTATCICYLAPGERRAP